MYQYILNSKAQEEYETSVNFYSEKGEEIAIKFVETTEKTIILIRKKPYLYKKSYKNFHEAVIKNFPFSIIYSVEEQIKTVIIFSVFHNNRNPKKKYK
ncbi:MAG: type II toxin-antitoxin system RelE/ParE family toxin [Bacteroidetes bacterium]|nr:type II toxin-antitoxin system RelE/ParE family toxin [Bacteroidota bacterium]